jgi:hypothetical protein
MSIFPGGGFLHIPSKRYIPRIALEETLRIGCFRLSPFLLVLLLNVYVREVQIDFGR